MKTAILVDGGFYRKRAKHFAGDKTPQERAKELISYCRQHLFREKTAAELYRIFYYDCPPVDKQLFHPLKQKNVDFSKQPTYRWAADFLDELKHQRKVALRLGFLAADEAAYELNRKATKQLFNGKLKLSDVRESDFTIALRQKGVDMKIGIDIATLSYKIGQSNQPGIV